LGKQTVADFQKEARVVPRSLQQAVLVTEVHLVAFASIIWDLLQCLFKTDSHMACHSHAVPMPCRAAEGLECIFHIWFTQCGRVWFTLAVPCPCHAPTMPFFSRPQHSTAVDRQ